MSTQTETKTPRTDAARARYWCWKADLESSDPAIVKAATDQVLEIPDGFEFAAMLEVELTTDHDALRKAREALEFYADPDSYVAIMFVGDPPCGDFINDFSEVETEWGKETRPGNTARAALTLIDQTLKETTI